MRSSEGYSAFFIDSKRIYLIFQLGIEKLGNT